MNFKKSNAVKVLFFAVLLGVLCIAFVPQFVGAQQGTVVTTTGDCKTIAANGLVGAVKCLISVMSVVLGVLIAGAVVFTAYGAFEMLSSEEKRESGKQRIYHGIIGLFVMVSIWGLVSILVNTFNLGTQGPIKPTLLESPL